MSIISDHPRLRGPRPVPASRRPALLSVTAKRDGLLEVARGSAVLGYVEVVEPVFVALAGPRYDIAVEIAQSLDLERALAELRDGPSLRDS
jgi:hypothetical protein